MTSYLTTRFWGYQTHFVFYMSMSLKVIDGDNYMRNASLSLSSGEPLEVTCRASMNSLHTKCHLGSIFLCIFRFCISIASLFYVTVLNISNKIKCVKSQADSLLPPSSPRFHLQWQPLHPLQSCHTASHSSPCSPCSSPEVQPSPTLPH